MNTESSAGSHFVSRYISELWTFADSRRETLKSIGMITSASLVGNVLGVVGSLVQAHFISPDDLGFVRKYSVISGYAFFLSLGLFDILQREYPVLVGQGKRDQARRVAAIGQTWCIISSSAVSGGLIVVCLLALFRGEWREACAWLIQVFAVAGVLYGGYLTTTFRSGQEFGRLAKGSFLSSTVALLVLPFFVIWPFATLVLRSLIFATVSPLYMHIVRPVKVGWSLPLGEFSGLVKRGMRLFVGSYLRGHFWLTVEIWLMLRFSGDAGVGLFVFSSMIVGAMGQLAIAVNQVYLPRLAQYYGSGSSIGACLRLSLKPTALNVVAAALFCGVAWLALPPILKFAFPKYVPAIPFVNVLMLGTISVGLSLPLSMVPVLEDYATQFWASVVGLSVFVGIAFLLHSSDSIGMSVVWGTVVGRFALVAISFASLGMRLKKPHSLCPP